MNSIINDSNKEIDILFAVTPKYLTYAIVTALSIKDNTNAKVNCHFLYADLYNNTPPYYLQNFEERVAFFCKKYDINLHFYNVTKDIPLIEKQNIGMWGVMASLSHYLYFLAPKYIKNRNKILYMDVDTIVNGDISLLFDIELRDKYISIVKPSGFEELGDDCSNAGVVLFNLELWRKDNFYLRFLKYGESLKDPKFCAQNLIYRYFLKEHPELVVYFDERFNVFPHMRLDLDINEICVFHFSGDKSIKPWDDFKGKMRGSYIWWFYANRIPFVFENIMQKFSTIFSSCSPDEHIFRNKCKKRAGNYS